MPSSSFDPTTIPNLIARFKSGVGTYQDTAGTTPAVANGATVQRINSSVGSGYLTASANSGTLILNAVNGQTAVRHAGTVTNGWAINGVTITNGQAFTLFISQNCAARGTPAANGSPLCELGNSKFYWLQGDALQSNNGLSFTPPVLDNQEVFTFQSTASNLLFRQNGVQTATGTALASGSLSASLSLFGWTDNSSAQYFGDTYEVLLYNRILTTAELQQVEGMLLANVPTYVPGGAPCVIVFAGNSLIAGAGAQLNTAEIPNIVLSQLPSGAGGYAGINTGIGGTATPDWIATYKATNIDPYLVAGRKNVCVFWELSNDIVQNNATAATAYANYKSLAQSLTNEGFSVILLDCINRSGANQTTINAVNALLAADFPNGTTSPRVFTAGAGVTYAVALVQLSQVADLQNTATTALTGGVHPTRAGNVILASDVIGAINLLFPVSGGLITTYGGSKSIGYSTAAAGGLPGSGSAYNPPKSYVVTNNGACQMTAWAEDVNGNQLSQKYEIPSGLSVKIPAPTIQNVNIAVQGNTATAGTATITPSASLPV